MADPKSDGRMIRKDVSDSHKIASLSPQAAVLFFMLIPHYNSYGKMNGGPGHIKDEIVPFIEYFTYENLPGYLQEIHDKTNVKWFKSGGRYWLHSLKFLTDHQKLDKSKLGADLLPTYSGVSLEIVADEVEVEVEDEVEVKEGRTTEEVLTLEAKDQTKAFIPVETVDNPPDIVDKAVMEAQRRLVDKRQNLERRGEGEKPESSEHRDSPTVLQFPPVNSGIG